MILGKIILFMLTRKYGEYGASERWENNKYIKGIRQWEDFISQKRQVIYHWREGEWVEVIDFGDNIFGVIKRMLTCKEDRFGVNHFFDGKNQSKKELLYEMNSVNDEPIEVCLEKQVWYYTFFPIIRKITTKYNVVSLYASLKQRKALIESPYDGDMYAITPYEAILEGLSALNPFANVQKK